jgi:glycosyltransferase involved in cell wall biosynthesis
MSSSSDLLLVLPVFNEVDLVKDVCKDIQKAIRKYPKLRVCIVDDGSTDGTGDAFRRTLKKVKNTEVKIFPQNGGKGRAVREGLRGAKEKYQIFMDGDLAYSIDHLNPMKLALLTNDMVIGSRSMVPQAQGGLPARRAVLGWGFNRLVCFLLGFDYADTQAGLKGFTKAAADKLFSRQKLNEFAFDAELLYLAKKLGLRVGQICAQVSPRHTYKTSHVNLFLNSLSCLLDIFCIRWWSWTGAYRSSR